MRARAYQFVPFFPGADRTGRAGAFERRSSFRPALRRERRERHQPRAPKRLVRVDVWHLHHAQSRALARRPRVACWRRRSSAASARVASTRANSDTRFTRKGDPIRRHLVVTILRAVIAIENARTTNSDRMRTSAQSSGRRASARRGLTVVWSLACAWVAACSLMAPNDEHYLSGPSLTKPEGGQIGDAGRSNIDAGAGGDVSANMAGRAGADGGASGSDAGGSSGGEAVLVCSGNFADCNQRAGDGCEVDLSSSHDHCGGCGADFACANDQSCEHGSCISPSGCSDGTREAFLPIADWPLIAGCTAQWPRSSLRAPKTGHACGFETHVCEVPADACAAGWHVCASVPYGSGEVSSQATQEECAAQPGAFVAAVGDQNCEPCSDAGDGAACCGDLCVQQNGSCIYRGMTAWFGVYNNYKNVCGAIESQLVQRGVLCCRAP